MQNAHHALEVFEIPAREIREMIPRMLADAGFKVTSSSPSEPSIRARRGSAIGLTDQETGRIMEVIIQEVGGNSAVSVYHHTSGVGPFVGATWGDTLRDEVNALFATLGETIAANRLPENEPTNGG